MKKKLWGYDTKAVDELVDSLQGQIEILNMKITGMAMELSSKAEGSADTSELEEQVKSLNQSVESLKSEKAELETQLHKSVKDQPTNSESAVEWEKLTGEQESLIEELKQEKYALLMQVEKLTEDFEQLKASHMTQDTKEELEKLCHQTCQEMKLTKDNIMEEMQVNIKTFSTYSSDANQQIQASVNYIKNLQKELGDYLVQTFESIVENLDTFTENSSKVQEHLIPVEDLAEDFNKQIQLLEKKMKAAQETAQAMISNKELTPRLSRLVEEAKDKNEEDLTEKPKHKLIQSPILGRKTTIDRREDPFKKISSDVS